MFAHTKGILIAACLLLGTLSLVGGSSNVPAPPNPNAGGNAPVSLENATVLIELFVVEVDLPALAELGVSPIGQEPHAVSVAAILKCLDAGRARVVAGAKASSQGEKSTSVQTKKTVRVTREASSTDRVPRSDSYQASEQLSIMTSVYSAATVRVDFHFSCNAPTGNPATADALPNLVNWEWSGGIILEMGQAEIAAATQDGDEAVFLLVTAHIERQ
jgi:hypothetical protein